MSSYFKTQSPSSTAVASTGIQTESATAVGATDIYQLQDIELQLGLAEIYKREDSRIGRKILATSGRPMAPACTGTTATNWTLSSTSCT